MSQGQAEVTGGILLPVCVYMFMAFKGTSGRHWGVWHFTDGEKRLEEGRFFPGT